MVRVMIVDDEVLVRIGIRSIINWEQHGYSVVSEAGNSREAIEKLPKSRPHIILTDLMMDGMDGFDLIEYCKQNYPDIRIAVLSSHNEFEHVRRAMKMGAVDYIFKLTVKPEELLKVLDEMRASPQESIGHPDKIILKNLSAIKTRLIYTGIQQSYISRSDYLAEFKALGLDTDFELRYMILYISIDDFAKEQRRDSPAQIQLLKASMENVIHEVISSNHKGETYNYADGDLIIVYHPEIDGDCFYSIEEDFHTIAEYLHRYLGVSVSAAMSDPYKGLDALPAAVSQAVSSIKHRFWGKKRQFYLPPVNSKGESQISSEIKPHDLSDALLAGNLSIANEYITYLMNVWWSKTDVPIDSIRQIILTYYVVFVRYCSEQSIDINSIRDSSGITLYDAIIHYDFLESIQKSFYEFIDQLGSLTGKHPGRPEILETKRYIRDNLSNELNIESMAERVNISKSYFSHMFKKETGSSFIDYVNNVRIDRAKELLISSNMRVNEIASEVGIHNPNYFGIIFKKLTGMTPGDYRASINEGKIGE